MKLLSPAHGNLEFSETDVVRFPEGMIGFPDSHRYLILHNPETEPFRPLQSVDIPHLAFVTIDPRLIWKDYSVSITVEDMRSLELDKADEVTMLVVVILPEDYSQATANLKAPVLINHKRMLGRQVILPESAPYSHHEKLLR